MTLKSIHSKKRSPYELLEARYEGLIEFGKLLNTATNYQNIESKVADKIKSIINCEYVILYRLNTTTRELFVDYSCKGESRGVHIPVNELTFAGSCAHYTATLHITDVKTDLRFKRSHLDDWDVDINELLLTPLVSNGEVLGVVKAINSTKGEFSIEDIKFLEGVANLLTISVYNQNLYQQLKEQFYEVCEAFAESIGKKDKYTGGHTKRVGHFAKLIADEMNLSQKEWDDVKLASVLHDIGKIGIEDKILKKKSALTDAEFQIMREHPRLGYEILKHVKSLKDVIDGMRYHHEKVDGSGYPYGLVGDEIPLIARIISVADTFDAMVSTRPYRKGLAPMVAYHEIRKHSGGQFCEKVVDAFVRGFRKTKMYDAQADEYLDHQSEIKKAS